jgi:hypothetical protein
VSAYNPQVSLLEELIARCSMMMPVEIVPGCNERLLSQTKEYLCAAKLATSDLASFYDM